jgi:hypothetical protein
MSRSFGALAGIQRSFGRRDGLGVLNGCEVETTKQGMAGRARTSMVDDFEKVSPATILPMRFMGTELPNAARKRR